MTVVHSMANPAPGMVGACNVSSHYALSRLGLGVDRRPPFVDGHRLTEMFRSWLDISSLVASRTQAATLKASFMRRKPCSFQPASDP